MILKPWDSGTEVSSLKSFHCGCSYWVYFLPTKFNRHFLRLLLLLLLLILLLFLWILLLLLKGLFILRWTCSGIKGCDLLILPLILIFHFCDAPANGRDPWQKMSNPVGISYYLQLANPCNPIGKSLYSIWQILVILELASRIQG